MNAAHVILPLFLASILLVWAGTRHAHREERDRLHFQEHLRSLSVPERWLDLREREGRE